EYQQSGYVNPAQAKGPGQQAAPDYIMTGELASIVQRVGSDEFIYYKMTCKLTNIRTGILEWTDEKELKKKFVKQSIRPCPPAPRPPVPLPVLLRQSAALGTLCAGLGTGCAGDYIARTRGYRQAYESYHYPEADQGFAHEVGSGPQIDRLLALMDEGMVL